MSDNQYIYEVIRDLIPMIGKLKEGENIAISVTRDKGELFTWRTSNGTCYSSSETAIALRKAYEETDGRVF